MADVLKKAKDLWDKSRIAEVPGKTLEGLNLIDKAAGLPVKTAANLAGIGEHVPEGFGAQVDTAFGLPGRASTGFNAAVPPGLSQQAGQATTELTGSPLAGGIVGLGIGLVEPVPGPKVGGVSELSQLTTKVLDRIGNRAVVSRQFIEDLAKAPDLKGPERDVINRALQESGDERSIDVAAFKSRVEAELLPLTHSKQVIDPYGSGNRTSGKEAELRTRYEGIVLPEDVRGDVSHYYENVYQSPIANTTGSVHFGNPDYDKNSPKGYFAHTRVEDLTDGAGPSGHKTVPGMGPLQDGSYGPVMKFKDTFTPGGTRRIIEIQSDLFQRGRLDREKTEIVDPQKQQQLSKLTREYVDARDSGDQARIDAAGKAMEEFEHTEAVAREAELGPLAAYKNSWYERVLREETQQAAADGKDVVQVPTGETAMRVEGLAGEASHVPNDVEEGGLFDYGGEDYRVLNAYADGSVEVVPESNVENIFDFDMARADDIDNWVSDMQYEAKNGDYDRMKDYMDPKAFEYLQMHGLERFETQFPDEIEKAAEKYVDDSYSNADDYARHMSDNTGEEYRAIGDDIYYFGRSANTEMMQRGGGELDVDTDDPIYKFYQDDIGKYVKKRYGATEVTDDNGVTWWQYQVPKEAGRLPVEAFGAALLPLGASSMQTANSTPATLEEKKAKSPPTK